MVNGEDPDLDLVGFEFGLSLPLTVTHFRYQREASNSITSDTECLPALIVIATQRRMDSN